MSELRMDAYYYGFEATGVTVVDEVLSTVACAGKAFHNTEDWQEECRAFAPHCVGSSPIDWMQNAGNRAAEHILKMQARIAELEATNGSMQAVLDLFHETGRLRDNQTVPLPHSVTRIEVIDDSGRAYTNWRVDDAAIQIQDEGRTAKLFITESPRLRNGGSDGE